MRFAWLVSIVAARLSQNLEALGPRLPDRLFVIADLHGDFQQADRLLRAANVTDGRGDWLPLSGKKTWLLQLGDIVDRGPDSLPIYEHFLRLRKSAASAGDAVVNLMGNHELLNLCNQFHYVSSDEFINHYDGDRRAMRAVWQPDGLVGAFIRDSFEVAVRIDDVVFVHAGLDKGHSKDDFRDLKKQLFASVDEGSCQTNPGVVGSDGPLWTRKVSKGDCALLEHVLDDQQARVMVVGHTPTSSGDVEVACGGRLVMADVGISRWVRGKPRMVLVEKTGDDAPLSQWRWSELSLINDQLFSREIRTRALSVGGHDEEL